MAICPHGEAFCGVLNESQSWMGRGNALRRHACCRVGLTAILRSGFHPVLHQSFDNEGDVSQRNTPATSDWRTCLGIEPRCAMAQIQLKGRICASPGQAMNSRKWLSHIATRSVLSS